MAMATVSSDPPMIAARRLGRITLKSVLGSRGPEALGGFGEGLQVDRPQPGIKCPVHKGKGEDDVDERENLRSHEQPGAEALEERGEVRR